MYSSSLSNDVGGLLSPYRTGLGTSTSKASYDLEYSKSSADVDYSKRALGGYGGSGSKSSLEVDYSKTTVEVDYSTRDSADIAYSKSSVEIDYTKTSGEVDTLNASLAAIQSLEQKEMEVHQSQARLHREQSIAISRDMVKLQQQMTDANARINEILERLSTSAERSLRDRLDEVERVLTAATNQQAGELAKEVRCRNEELAGAFDKLDRLTGRIAACESQGSHSMLNMSQHAAFSTRLAEVERSVFDVSAKVTAIASMTKSDAEQDKMARNWSQMQELILQEKNCSSAIVQSTKKQMAYLSETLDQEKAERVEVTDKIGERVDSLQRSVNIFDSLIRKEMEDNAADHKKIWLTLDSHTHDVSAEVVEVNASAQKSSMVVSPPEASVAVVSPVSENLVVTTRGNSSPSFYRAQSPVLVQPAPRGVSARSPSPLSFRPQAAVVGGAMISPAAYTTLTPAVSMNGTLTPTTSLGLPVGGRGYATLSPTASVALPAGVVPMPAAVAAAEAQAVACSNCGNVFMDDSNFCRKCGEVRKAITALSHPQSPSFSTRMASSPATPTSPSFAVR